MRAELSTLTETATTATSPAETTPTRRIHFHHVVFPGFLGGGMGSLTGTV